MSQTDSPTRASSYTRASRSNLIRLREERVSRQIRMLTSIRHTKGIQTFSTSSEGAFCHFLQARQASQTNQLLESQALYPIESHLVQDASLLSMRRGDFFPFFSPD